MSRRVQKSIFDTPAIVKLVHAYLDPSDSARLARSSRQLFQTLMPLLWERVDDLGQIFTLLPALDEVQTPEKDLTENDFSRFNVYALWIRHLEVVQGDKSPKSSQLDVICHYAAPRNLLPNITSIKCFETEMAWLFPFLSSSLLRLEYVDDGWSLQNCELSMTNSLILLHIVSEKCPKMQRLAVYSDTDEEESTSNLETLKYMSSDNKAKVQLQLQQGPVPFIASTPPLVRFATSENILNHACFEIISTWPLLESLAITLNAYKYEYAPPKVPATAFPSLKHLALYWLPDCKTFRRLWNIPALVGKLTSVKILPCGDLCREKSQFRFILEPILGTLAEKSPHLENLWFRALDPDATRAWYHVPLSSLEVLKKVPLKRLYIEGVDFRERVGSKKSNNIKQSVAEKKSKDDKDQSEGGGEKDEGEDEDEGENGDGPESEDEKEDSSVPLRKCPDVGERLITMFPDLKELGFPRHELPPTDISMFHSKMPHLEALRFDFKPGSVSAMPVDLEGIPRLRASPFRVFEANFLGMDETIKISGISDLSHYNAVTLAQYLFSLWPNVQIEAVEDVDEMEEYTAHRQAITLINEYLTLLSYCNRDPSMKYEDVYILDKTSWKSCRE
ncbi:hypothetical protein FRC12_016892 [Ceratobasidium sp. 428]|nr:hypothetical protein FRC12_016892 [Ceratobasidium sp. 428]